MLHCRPMDTRTLLPALLACAALLSGCGSKPAPVAPPSVASAPAPAPPAAPAAAPVDVVLEPKGDVSVEPLGTDTWSPVAERVLLAEGCGIKTGTGASAAITFPDGSMARINAETTLYLAEVGTPDVPGVSLQLVTGEVWSRVQHIVPGGKFEVRTDTTLAVVRGTEFDVAADGGGTTTVEAHEHAVDVATIEAPPDDPDGDPIISPQTTLAEGERVSVTPAMMDDLQKRRAAVQKSGGDARAPMKVSAMKAVKMDAKETQRGWIGQNHAQPTTRTALTPQDRKHMQEILKLPPPAPKADVAKRMREVRKDLRQLSKTLGSPSKAQNTKKSTMHAAAPKTPKKKTGTPALPTGQGSHG